MGSALPMLMLLLVVISATREPHNSVISVLARLRLIGLISWLWMQIELFRAGLRAYLECRRTGRRQSADLVLLLIAFAVLARASCLGRDTWRSPTTPFPTTRSGGS
jgi:O-antigen ligase